MQSTQHTYNGLIYREGFTGEADASHYDLLIFAMHYMTGNASAMQFIFEGFEPSARLIFPQAMYALPDAEGKSYSWYPDEDNFYNQRTEAQQAPDIRIATDKVADLIRHLREGFTGKVALVGMSQGGDITSHLLAYYPELMDVAIPMAGRLSAVMRPDKITAEKLPTVHILTGDQDQYVPVEGVREVKSWLALQGYKVTMKEYIGVRHDIPDEAISDVQMILSSI